jgi:hypothetical protein
MPHTVTVEAYRFDELSPRAKECARDWWRDSGGPDEYDYIIDDIVHAGQMLGIEFTTNPVKLFGGGLRHAPALYWSVGFSQSDYAAFEGVWHYRRGSLADIRKEYPKDTSLQTIAADLQRYSKAAFYQLTAYCRMNQDSQRVSVDWADGRYAAIPPVSEQGITGALQVFAQWAYQRLRDEVEYQHSDEVVDENIRCNGYEFDVNGRLL